MQRFTSICGALLFVFAGLAGCGPDPEVVAEQERQQQWQAIEEGRQALDAKRQELGAAIDAAAAAAAENGEATENGAAEAAASAIDGLEGQVEEAREAFSTQLVEFINANAPAQGEEPPELVGQAIRMKSDEDILVAQEFIQRGGDYRQAIQIYDVALVADPNYARLTELKTEAATNRYMSEERFGQVENGMTRDEVKALLGPVNLRNIRDYEEKDSVAWFYPRDERGSAAAVWFNKNRKGDFVVYQSDFNFKEADDGA